MFVAGVSPNMAYCTWVDEEHGEVRHTTVSKAKLVRLSPAGPPPKPTA
jgi:hypothetical protein